MLRAPQLDTVLFADGLTRKKHRGLGIPCACDLLPVTTHALTHNYVSL